MKLKYSDHRAHINRLMDGVLEAADPFRLVKSTFQAGEPRLTIHNREIKFPPDGDMILLAVGKASTPMLLAAAQEIDRDFKEVIIARPETDRTALPSNWQIFQAGHPLPNELSLAAGNAVRQALRGLRADDLVILLLSGGGSALLELPKPDIELKGLRELNEDLLRSGAPIEEINIVRKSMSLIKGGGLARMAAPAGALCLILSDVVGDDLGMVASGPTVLEPANTDRAREILQRYGLWERYPEGIRAAILADQDTAEPAKPPVNILLANNRTVTTAAAREATRMGFDVEVLPEPLSGEARTAGSEFARHLIDIAAARPQSNVCLIQGGETTVTVHGTGQGGRNQEFAVSAAQSVGNSSRLVVLSFATDGVDGPTDAAGAIVESGFSRRAEELGLDARSYLDNNDVYRLLDRMGALIRTGPTQTNLNDIAVGFSYSDQG
jgi:hydroxypyruvate reductase